MNKASFFQASLLSMISVGLVGCDNLSRSPGDQGATGGGMSGAPGESVMSQSGSSISPGNALAPGASLIIEANAGGVFTAPGEEQRFSPLVRKALSAPTADINGDGFVTIDDVLAMRQAGLTDDEILERLRATHQVFELTLAQQDYLRSRGISKYVIEQMLDLNGGSRPELLQASGGGRRNLPADVISVPPLAPVPPPLPP